MNNISKCLVGGLCLLALTPISASAKTGDGPLGFYRVMGIDIAKLGAPKPPALNPRAIGDIACFSRSYTADHLSKHPDQLVTSMSIRFKRTDETYSTWSMNVTMRGRTDVLFTGGACDSGTGSCSVDCDGGSIVVEENARSLLVSLVSGLRLTSDCGEEEETGVTLKSGLDDKIFRLNSVPVDQCRQ